MSLNETASSSSSSSSEKLRNHVNGYRRIRRSTPNNLITYNAYSMEVLIGVDRKMQEYHGENLKAYILTLMSIVSILCFYLCILILSNKNINSMTIRHKRLLRKSLKFDILLTNFPMKFKRCLHIVLNGSNKLYRNK